MIYRPALWQKLVIITSLTLVCSAMRTDMVLDGNRLSARMRALPRTTVWAWERPEDLRALSSEPIAVASLDQTIVLGSSTSAIPRHQPLVYPHDAVRISVVRIESVPGARLDALQRRQAVELLLRSSQRPGIAALQVDFDARKSQRGFYRDLLWELRSRMRARMPLSITALASWCSYDDWIADLPIDEAVPMLFRMEPDRRNASPDRPQFRISEPLCKGSVGVSTHEAWPAEMDGKRIYVFADRGWRSDLSLLAERNLE